MVANTSIDQRVAQLLARLDRESRDEALMRERESDIRERVAAYEAKYGIPSSEIHEAIDDGRLVDSHEVGLWIMDREILERIDS